MSVALQDDLQQIWDKVRAWPQPLRISLAAKILRSIEADQERPKKSLRDLVGILATDQPPPTDEEVERMLEERIPMTEPRIVNRGDGPKVEGTRITVYTVLEYLKHGHSREWIADWLRLSPAQVQAAMDYIRDNEEAVNAAYERIMARIAKGNPPEILAKFEESRKKRLARMDELRARKEHSPG